jgi:YggT family protein
MFIIGNLLAAVAQIIQMLLTAVTWLILIRVLVSWVNPDPFNPIVQFLVRTTDPILEPIRRRIPPLGFLDISPIVALVLLEALRLFLVRTLLDLSMKLR